MAAKEAPEKKRMALRLPTLSLENDISYRGPLSCRLFRFLGWICIVLSFAAVMMELALSVNAENETRLRGWISAIAYIADLSFPFLLIANFSVILNNTEGYRKQLVKNGAAMLGIALLFLLFFNKYLLGTVRLVSAVPDETEAEVISMVRSTADHGFLAFNIFVDLFLCTAFMFFLSYRPKRIFTGKAHIVFRLFTLLPVAWEAACVTLKVLSSLGQAVIPADFYPWLTVKPPMTFALFVAMAFFVKARELRSRRSGKTHEEYRLFLQTKRNSLHFSVFAAAVMLAAGILDYLVLEYGPPILSGGDPALAVRASGALLAVGFGNSVILAALSPFMLLYSYTRRPGNSQADAWIPVAGICLLVLVFFQGTYQILLTAKLPKLGLTNIRETLQTVFRSIRVP